MDCQHSHSRAACQRSTRWGRSLVVVVLALVWAPAVMGQHSWRLPEFSSHRQNQANRSSCDANTNSNCCCGAGASESCVDRYLPRCELGLPMLAEMAESRGFTLPVPLGVSAVSSELNRSARVSDIRIGIGNNPPQSVRRLSVGDVNMHASTQLGRFDGWLFPFLNVYGIAGHTHSTGQIQATIDQFPLPGSPAVSVPIDVDLNGFTYGGGGTLAVGTKDYFATLDMNYTLTDFGVFDSELTSLVIAPRVGVVIKRPHFKGAIHIGAMYQDTDQTIDITVYNPTLGPIRVSVDQFEPEQWNFITGLLWGIDERLHAMVELGIGQRNFVISGLTVRF